MVIQKINTYINTSQPYKPLFRTHKLFNKNATHIDLSMWGLIRNFALNFVTAGGTRLLVYVASIVKFKALN